MRYLVILMLLTASVGYGQTVPQGINYQAIALDENGQPIPGVDIVGRPIDNAEVGVRITILENSAGGQEIYQELHEVRTDLYGMFNLVIGEGLQSSVTGFNSINWSGDKYLKVELSVDNNGDYKLSAVQQLMSVPYALLSEKALYAESALSVINNDDADADSTNEIQQLSISNDTLFLSQGGIAVLPADEINDADADPLNEIQTISKTGATITLSSGGSVTVFDGDYNSLLNAPSIPTKTSDIVNDSGFLTSEIDGSTTNELQALTISNDTVYLSNGGFVVLPADQVDDADADTTNELQNLYVVDDTLKIANGHGAVYLPFLAVSRPQELSFNSCTVGGKIDSIEYSSSSYSFLASSYKNTLFSASNTTLILDSTNQRLHEYNFLLQRSNRTSRSVNAHWFNSGVQDNKLGLFVGMRLNNNSTDSIGATYISANDYVLVLDSSGSYVRHFDLDTLISKYNVVQIDALRGDSVWISAIPIQTTNLNSYKVINYTLGIHTGSVSRTTGAAQNAIIYTFKDTLNAITLDVTDSVYSSFYYTGSLWQSRYSVVDDQEALAFSFITKSREVRPLNGVSFAIFDEVYSNEPMVFDIHSGNISSIPEVTYRSYGSSTPLEIRPIESQASTPSAVSLIYTFSNFSEAINTIKVQGLNTYSSINVVPNATLKMIYNIRTKRTTYEWISNTPDFYFSAGSNISRSLPYSSEKASNYIRSVSGPCVENGTLYHYLISTQYMY